jgi:hypothetical protein
MAIRHFFQIFRFFGEATTFALPADDAVREAGTEGAKHASFHRRIVAVAVLGGVVGAGLGTAMLASGGGKAPERDGAMLILAPRLFAAIGLIFGVAVACLFAPRAFLAGPVGRRWMELIGTQSVFVARLVCAIFTLLMMGIVGLMIWVTWMEMQRGPG